jgi:hypothetical protein
MNPGDLVQAVGDLTALLPGDDEAPTHKLLLGVPYTILATDGGRVELAEIPGAWYAAAHFVTV